MVDPEHAEEALFPERVGDRLRAARVKAGLDLSDIASKTRVPLRHLSAIEAGDYSSFPSSTYCVGFVKAYARAVGEDDAALARALRGELGEVRPDPRTDFYDVEDADPARLPTARLAWTAAAILLILVGAYWGFRQWQLADPRDTAPPIAVIAAPRAPQAAAPVATSPGQVVLTARDKVWVRIYDANDQVLLQRELAAGETFAVPATADVPQIRTSRPELLIVTVGGREVAPLGTAERLIKDVGISAAALTARSATVPSSPPTATEPPANRPAQPARQTQREPAAAVLAAPDPAPEPAANVPPPVTTP